MKKIIYLSTLCLLLVGCGNDTTNNPSSEKVDKDKVEEKSQKETKEEQTNKGFDLKQVGEKFTLKDWEVTLESFKFDKSVSDGQMSSSADEGNKFLLLNFKITNNGTEADSLIKNGGGTSIKAVYNNKYDYDTSVTLIDGDLHHQNIRPLSSSEGFVVITVPDTVVEGKESINLFLENEKDKVQINIR
ncbi:DUF4352 domain-containing protein [Lysinibacillus sp. CTST325]